MRTTTRSSQAGNGLTERYSLILQLAGQVVLRQDRIETHLGVGGAAVMDMNAPFAISYIGKSMQLSIHIPRTTAGAQTRALTNLIGHALPTGSARLIHALACAAFEQRALPEGPSAAVVSNALIELATVDGENLPRRRDLKAPSLARVKRFVALHAGDAYLSPQSVSLACGVSERQLYRLFQQCGDTFSSFVRNVRLDHCAADLRDPRGCRTSLTEIAHRWGFADSAHLSRSFSVRFGQPPKDHRVAAMMASDAHV